MRIGIDYDPALRAQDGIARYVRELVAELVKQSECEIYLFGQSVQGMPCHGCVRQVAHGMSPLAWRTELLKSHLGVRSSFEWPQLDLFHATDFVFPPASSRVKSVVVSVHDLIPLIRPHGVSWKHRLFFAVVLMLIKWRKPIIIVPTNVVALQVQRIVGMDVRRIFVVPYGVRPLDGDSS